MVFFFSLGQRHRSAWFCAVRVDMLKRFNNLADLSNSKWEIQATMFTFCKKLVCSISNEEWNGLPTPLMDVSKPGSPISENGSQLAPQLVPVAILRNRLPHAFSLHHDQQRIDQGHPFKKHLSSKFILIYYKYLVIKKYNFDYTRRLLCGQNASLNLDVKHIIFSL